MADAPLIERARVSANGIVFEVMTCGSGPLALCLHGFPDTAHSWRYLLPELANAGFRAVAPFMRGYAPTSLAPNGAYQTASLATDANALHEALGGDSRAVIIGHDWGAPATYGAAILEPSRWSRVVGMSVPPWNTFGSAFLTNQDQIQRSWYMFFFQHPLSDHVVSSNDMAFIDRLWSQWSPGYDGSADARRVKESLADPAHLAAALGYYRATLGQGYRDPALAEAQTAMQTETPSQPVLYLHGETDGCIGVELARDADSRKPDNARVVVVEGAGHFLQLEQPERVNRLIVDWVTAG
ncbi:MAG: alpha/beta hydrolase [Actinobacteria bacterium]|nr:alpha/beta hydrolase [Actinomycetota bacterium]